MGLSYNDMINSDFHPQQEGQNRMNGEFCYRFTIKWLSNLSESALMCISDFDIAIYCPF